MQADFGYYSTFSVGSDGKLHTIAKIRTDENTVFNNAFNYCTALKNVTFEGVIGQDINIRWSPLTADSIRSIIEHLSDTASGKTLTLSKKAVNNADFGGQAIRIDGTYAEVIRINPIINIDPEDIPEGGCIRYELVVDDNHYIETATWDNENYEDYHEDPNYWIVGLLDDREGYTSPNHRYVDGNCEIWFERYRDNGIPAIFGIRAVIVDANGNEVTGENLYNGVVEVEGKVSDATSWEALAASKPNWTISLV